MKKWVILNKIKDQISKIKDGEIVKILLENRGLIGKKEIEEFLNPTLGQLTLESVGLKKKELDRAVNRIKKAIHDNESMIVWTDYDVDGIFSGAIVWETLHALGCKVLPYVPHRIEEGYGLSKKGIDFVKKEYSASLIITVDHGITAEEKIAYAKSQGIETIIIDHHLLPDKLPEVSAVVHTTSLCATGIAWFFADYLISKFPHLNVKNDNLDLAAIATVADLVPLLGANRTLVYHGLKKLNKTKRIGLKALIKEAGIEGRELGVYEISHILSPRINALGRLAHALDALRLICTKDSERATGLARTLNITNCDRRLQTESATYHAINKVRKETETKLLYISHKDYQQGIIGLVAGRLVEEFNKPAIVISEGIEYSKASARSINGFNIVEFIRQASDLLVDVGGHPMAAGFTVLTENIEKLKSRLMLIIDKSLEEKRLEKVIKIDLELDLEMVDTNFYTQINRLSPFGISNPEPVFVSRNLEVVKASIVGKDQNHLRLSIRSGKRSHDDIFNAIGFRMGELGESLQPGKQIDIVYTINEDKWNGKTSLQLKLKDVKFAKT